MPTFEETNKNIKLYFHLIKDRRVKDLDVFVYGILENYNFNPELYPPISEIAEIMNRSEQTIKRSIEKLKKLKLIDDK